jgi:hypothetical protein
MEVAVADNDSDTTVESGNTCYCSCNLECALITWPQRTKKLLYIIFESNSVPDLFNNHRVISTRNLLIEI